MLAAREVTQESTGFSPNDLVFGHTVRGPLSVLVDHSAVGDPPQSLADYVSGSKRRLHEAGRMAREKLAVGQGKMKHLYDRGTVYRTFDPGDRVMGPLAGGEVSLSH